MAVLTGGITPDLAGWIREQPMFFVATAPLSGDGHVNLSPKGLDSFRVLTSTSVAYLDLVGSGVETIAHVRENGRLTLMFCSFGPKPRIVRLYGRGASHQVGTAAFDDLAGQFPAEAGARAIIVLTVDRVSSSCGFGVPLMTLDEERPTMREWAARKSPAELDAYKVEKNTRSIDGLPGLPGLTDPSG